MIAALFVRADSIYKQLPEIDAWDMERDARRWPGGCPCIAHPPCRAWGKLRGLAKPREDEKDLARWAVAQVRKWGGVLEHPKSSTLWQDQKLPAPGYKDEFAGWTLGISQHWFGHRARKDTLLYIVGLDPADLPPIPYSLHYPTHIVGAACTRRDGTRPRKGDPLWRPEISKREREHTPRALAEWLAQVARLCCST